MEIIFVRHGQTDTNVANKTYGIDDDPSINSIGITQAEKTGKYLQMFGKFDMVFSSPKSRCLETAQHINKNIDYNKDIIIDKLLAEKSTGLYANKTPEEIENMLNKHKKTKSIQDEINKEKNPFKLAELRFKYDTEKSKHGKVETPDDLINRINKFLNKIKKLKCKRVLVVTHSSILAFLNGIITNIYKYSHIFVVPPEYSYVSNPVRNFVQKGNCAIIGIKLEDNKFKLVIPANNLHLEI